jgi:hypothetical protein
MLITVGILFLLVANPSNAYSCERSDLLGSVKSVIVTEAFVDPITAKIGETRLALRIDVSKDRAIEETRLYALESPAEPREKITSYFENGRLTRQIEVADGKTISRTVTCSYDAEGRLTEVRTNSNNGELITIEKYEYGSGTIRRRAQVLGHWTVTNQTLDALGRVVKEVTLDEAKLTIENTSEFTYSGDTQEQCIVTSLDPRRRCATTVRDSHGNEVEFLAEGQTRKTTFEYDSNGNWISKRTLVRATSNVETIVRRKIEYW